MAINDVTAFVRGLIDAYKNDLLKFDRLVAELTHDDFNAVANCLNSSIEHSLDKIKSTAFKRCFMPGLKLVGAVILALPLIAGCIITVVLGSILEVMMDDKKILQSATKWFAKKFSDIVEPRGQAFVHEYNRANDLRDFIEGMIDRIDQIRNPRTHKRERAGESQEVAAVEVVQFRKVPNTLAIYKETATGKIFVPLEYTRGDLRPIGALREAGFRLQRCGELSIKQCTLFTGFWELDPMRNTTSDRQSSKQKSSEKTLVEEVRKIENAFLEREPKYKEYLGK